MQLPKTFDFSKLIAPRTRCEGVGRATMLPDRGLALLFGVESEWFFAFPPPPVAMPERDDQGGRASILPQTGEAGKAVTFEPDLLGEDMDGAESLSPDD